jgi:prepilin-type N-terminal cleavage/methylation domain-containing protein
VINARPDDSGFTVLELLIVLTIVSFAVVALGSVLHTGQLAFRMTDEAARRVEELRLVRRVVGEALSQLPSGQPLTGNHHSLTLTSPGPRALATASAVTLTVGPDSDGSGLIASWRTSPGDAAMAHPTRHLVSPARQVRLAYYSVDSGWSDRWNAHKPPSLVRLLISERQDNRSSTSLSFQVRQLSIATCRLPASSERVERCHDHPID